VRLGEVCNKIGSGATPSGGKDSYKSVGIPLIRSQNVLDFSFSTAGLAFIDNKQAQLLDNVAIQENDVLVNITGDSVARVCMVPAEYVPSRVNQHVAIVRANPQKAVPSYLLYLLQHLKPHLLSIGSSGGTRNALTKQMLENLEIDLASLEEQVKIGNTLSALDARIAENKKINHHLEQMAQAIFKSWFVDFEPWSDTMPEDWREGTFSDIITITLGGDWGKETPIGNNTQEVYCIRGADIPDVNAGNKGKMPTRYILPKNYAAKKLNDGDIVVEISGGSPTQSTGRCALITHSLLKRYDRGMVCTNFCRAIKPMDGYSAFMYFYLRYLYNQNVMFSYENGTTGIKNLDITGLLETEPIFIPPVEIIAQFNETVRTFIDTIFANGLESESLATTRDALLPRLMSGEISAAEVTAK